MSFSDYQFPTDRNGNTHKYCRRDELALTAIRANFKDLENEFSRAIGYLTNQRARNTPRAWSSVSYSVLY